MFSPCEINLFHNIKEIVKCGEQWDEMKLQIKAGTIFTFFQIISSNMKGRESTPL